MTTEQINIDNITTTEAETNGRELVETFKPVPVKGYRELTKSEINLMNEVKDLGGVIETMTNKIKSVDGHDGRWLSIGITDLQKGLMSVIRAISKPANF